MHEDPEASGLSADEERTLAGVLDEIVPPSPERGLPGAGALGLVGYVGRALARAPELRPVVTQGLAALDARARERGAEGFAALPPSARRELLGELASAAPAFLPALTFQTYAGYYQQPTVLEALGLEARPPYPKGYEVEPSDPALLDPVRRRGKCYREC